MRDIFPCLVCAYRLVARNGLPPHPEDKPVEKRVVHSEEECDRAKKELGEKHPGVWLAELPID